MNVKGRGMFFVVDKDAEINVDLFDIMNLIAGIKKKNLMIGGGAIMQRC